MGGSFRRLYNTLCLAYQLNDIICEFKFFSWFPIAIPAGAEPVPAHLPTDLSQPLFSLGRRNTAAQPRAQTHYTVFGRSDSSQWSMMDTSRNCHQIGARALLCIALVGLLLILCNSCCSSPGGRWALSYGVQRARVQVSDVSPALQTVVLESGPPGCSQGPLEGPGDSNRFVSLLCESPYATD